MFSAPYGVRATPRLHSTMTAPLARLDVTKRVVKRAQYEAFEFSIEDTGVRVRNGSHANPENHEYLVTVADGLPSDCECPANATYDGACKHRVAVAIRRPVLDAALDRQVAADGGTPRKQRNAADTSSVTAKNTEPPTDCDCDELTTEFPCWECVRTGYRTLSNENR
ncbi:SWIM zinc finger family protein [Halostella salina]|uniref:SWIM zinc finger family protein n=1 Tax=Halostella salina TaxID=1547897 RepID=UPI0028731540|nr:SWIM zinc finger family protein [Halostella salina]